MDPDRAARLVASIRRETGVIERVVFEGASALASFAGREPTLLELRGLGDILHDFYTGLERLFAKVASETDGGAPEGAGWHRELLDAMSLDVPERRPPVLEESTARHLDEYLRFRHLFRNVYGFELEWGRVRPLLERLPAAFTAARRDVDRFVEFLAVLASGTTPE